MELVKTEESCTYCFNGTTNYCSECSDPICADHADEDNKCLDAEGNEIHTAEAPEPETPEEEAPKPKRRRSTAKS